jgi:plastocyanin
MKLIQLASLALLSILSEFSYGYPTNTGTSTAPATTHTFIVGSSNGTLRYDPTNITASPGDVVQWSFRAKNHTSTILCPHPLYN